MDCKSKYLKIVRKTIYWIIVHLIYNLILMKNIKSIFLFLLTNIVIVAVLNLIVFLISTYTGWQIFSSQGEYLGLAIFAIIFWFGGAYINLLISKWMAKKIYNITPISTHAHGKLWLVYDTVIQLASSHDIKMPEVGVYTSDEPNAFATGPRKDSSLIAVSTGLLDNMTDEEIKWVIGHEFAHVINGDMVTMTLLQWVINTFVIFLARVVAFAIDTAIKKDDDWWGFGMIGYYIVVTILDILLGFVGMIVLMWYSRHREYEADAWSARLLGKQAMIASLDKLKKLAPHTKVKRDEFATLKISAWGVIWFLSSHPSLDERISRLKKFHI